MIIMKKLCFTLVFAFVFLSAIVGIRAQSQVSAFTGNWILDKEKTSTSKDFPEKLKNYKMMVGGNENALKVKSQIEGKVEIESAGHGKITAVTESASMARGGAAAVSGIESAGNTGKINYGGTMAIFFTTNDATYNLNGEEVKVETPQGLVRVKAKPDKSGKGLQFTTIRRMKTPNGEIEIYIREAWKLSEDGKSLKLQRTIETPTARDEIVMTLAKVAQQPQ
ncbi:MAG: hypothetical protein ABI954_11650 [Pyrinomonadaceae bacterium]